MCAGRDLQKIRQPRLCFFRTAGFAYLDPMRTVLVLGAGRSSGALIDYLLEQSLVCDWNVIVGDKDVAAARARVKNHTRGRTLHFDPADHDESLRVIADADVVVSLLPPSLHYEAAKLCLRAGRHFLNASYVTEDMRKLDDDVKKAGLLFLNECGLDPGIDHMSAMEMIDRIRTEGGRVVRFESYTGGLIAPETDPENPWRYKFTWNPRNVVTAGQQGDAVYLDNGVRHSVPYQDLFSTTASCIVEHLGEMEGYPNRDSLQYVPLYHLDDVKTMIRGTLRFKGFCAAWNVLVHLGCCYDTVEMKDVASMTHLDFLETFVDKGDAPIEERLARQAGISVDGFEMKCLKWSGFFNREPIGITSGTPAQVLEHILMKEWKLKENERDLVVMFHRIGFVLGDKELIHQTCMSMKGSDEYTAMSTTVGLPLGIATKLLLTGAITQRGVVIPVAREFYMPILHELAARGIVFLTQES